MTADYNPHEIASGVPELELHISHQGRRAEIQLSGSFTFSANRAFKEVLDLAESGALESMRVTLSGVTFMDSAALGMLLMLRDKAQAGGVALTLHAPTGQVKKIFDLSRFEQLFQITS